MRVQRGYSHLTDLWSNKVPVDNYVHVAQYIFCDMYIINKAI